MGGGLPGCAAGLLLRALWICQHHRALVSDVLALRDGVAGQRRADWLGDVLLRHVREPCRGIDPLRHHSLADVLRDGVRSIQEVVGHRPAGHHCESDHLVDDRLRLVEGPEDLVGYAFGFQMSTCHFHVPFSCRQKTTYFTSIWAAACPGGSTVNTALPISTTPSPDAIAFT